MTELIRKNREQQVVAWALSRLGGPYVFGGTGKPCTPGYRKERIKQYPAYRLLITASCPVLSGQRNDCASCRHQGKPVYDCAQLVKYAMLAGGVKLPSGATSQWHSACWQEKGPLTAEAARTVCAVFKKGAGNSMDHVGLSLGDGRVIDARGHMAGTLLSPIDSYAWTHYALPLWPGDAAENKAQADPPADKATCPVTACAFRTPIEALERRVAALEKAKEAA